MPPEDMQATGDQSQGQQQDSSTKPDGKYNPSSVEDALKIITALEKRLEERDSALKETKREKDSLTAAQRKQLEEQGNYKVLAEQSAAEVLQLKAFKERAEILETIIRAGNEERIKTIPDNKKALVQPLLDALSPEKLQNWLNANPSLFVKEPAPNYDAGAGSGGPGNAASKLSADEVETAKRFGLTPEEYAKAKSGLAPK